MKPYTESKSNLPKDLLDVKLSAGAYRYFFQILHWSHLPQGCIYAEKTMAGKTGRCVRTIRNYKAELEKANFIRIEKLGGIGTCRLAPTLYIRHKMKLKNNRLLVGNKLPVPSRQLIADNRYLIDINTRAIKKSLKNNENTGTFKEIEEILPNNPKIKKYQRLAKKNFLFFHASDYTKPQMYGATAGL